MLIKTTLLLSLLFSFHAHATVTDVHVHTSSHGLFGSKIPDILTYMEKNKIDRALLLSAGYTYGFVIATKSVEEENNFVAEQVVLHPNKFVGVCSVPYYYEKALEEIKRCSQTLGLKGLKLHPIEDYIRVGKRVPNFNDPADFKILTDILKTAADNSMFVEMHSWYLTGQEIFYVLGDAARRYPHLKLVLIHGMPAHYEDLADIILLKKYFTDYGLPFPKVFLEISFAWSLFPKQSPRRKDWIKHLKWFGVENILFGSDTVAETDMPEALREYDKIFSKKELRMIKEDNADKLLQ